MDIAATVVCPQCHNLTNNQHMFCPMCGHRLKEPAISTSIGKQIGLYMLSFFLPPFGLIPAIKYIRQPDNKPKIVGGVMVGLTIVSIVLSAMFTIQFIDEFNKQVNSQLNLYQQVP